MFPGIDQPLLAFIVDIDFAMLLPTGVHMVVTIALIWSIRYKPVMALVDCSRDGHVSFSEDECCRRFRCDLHSSGDRDHLLGMVIVLGEHLCSWQIYTTRGQIEYSTIYETRVLHF